MRRIALTTVMAAALAAGAFAAPAHATTTTPYKAKFTAPDQFPRISAKGHLTKKTDVVVIRGVVRDTKRNGRTACVRFKFTEGTSVSYARRAIHNYNGGLADGRRVETFKVRSALTEHLYVQECAIVRWTGKAIYPTEWKQLY